VFHIRKWLNLEREAETQGQILSPLPSFPLLDAQTPQRSQEPDGSEISLQYASQQGFLQCEHPPQPRVLPAARGGCWAGMLDHF